MEEKEYQSIWDLYLNQLAQDAQEQMQEEGTKETPRPQPTPPVTGMEGAESSSKPSMLVFDKAPLYDPYIEGRKVNFAKIGDKGGYNVGAEIKGNIPLENKGVLSPFVAVQRTVVPEANIAKNSLPGAGIEYTNKDISVGARYDHRGNMGQIGGIPHLWQLYLNKQF